MEKKKDFMIDAKVKKVIGGDYKKLTLVIENGKFEHYNKMNKLIEDDLISVNPNVIFEIECNGDEETAQFVEAVGTLSVSRQVKQYIMCAFLKGALVTIDKVIAEKDDVDEATGRKYEDNEFSYRITKVTLPTLNPLVKQMILSDVQNQTILEPKKTVSAPNVFTMNQSVVL